MEEIEKIAYKGHVINIFQDEDYNETPNDWGDGVTLVHYHRDFTIEAKKLISGHELESWYNGEKIEQEKTHYIFPVSALIHSGVWLSLSDTFASDGGGWDTSHVGALLVDKKEAKSRKDAYRIASGTLQVWNDLLSGNVYGYVIDEDGDSCWGFIGDKDKDGVIDAAKEAVDCINPKDWEKEQTMKKLDALKIWEMGLTAKERETIERNFKSIEKQLKKLSAN